MGLSGFFTLAAFQIQFVIGIVPGKPDDYELNLNPERDIVYLCGNPDMVDQAMAWLKELGFPVARVRREKYLFARS